MQGLKLSAKSYWKLAFAGQEAIFLQFEFEFDIWIDLTLDIWHFVSINMD